MKNVKWVLLFAVLVGFLALNHGFVNWAIPIFRWRIPVGHMLALAAVLLALPGNWKKTPLFFKEPVVIAFIVLVLLSVGHLIFDLRKFGGYAARDATFVAESGFLFLGFLWAQNRNNEKPFMRCLAGVFLVTFLYSLTAVWADFIVAHSPTSGVFQRIPIFGIYAFIIFPLQTGALFFIMVSPHFNRWPKSLLWTLAILQIGWMFYFQSRSTYITFIVVALLALVLDGMRRALHILALHLAGFLALIAVASLLSIWGIKFLGRNGEVSLNFYKWHFLNKKMANVTTTTWRLNIWREAIERWQATPAAILVGEGFGRPLTSLYVPGVSLADQSRELSIAVRQPHNIHLTMLARLGLLGFLVWVFIQARILFLFFRSLKRGPRGSPVHAIILWFLLFYVTGLILSSVQPWLEWPFGAIPFYTVLGFALFRITLQSEWSSEKKMRGD